MVQTFLLKHLLLAKILTTPTSAQTPTIPPLTLISSLQSQLKLAGSLLSQSPALSTPVPCPCQEFCSGRCFAPSCLPCPPGVFDGEKEMCLASGPFGTGLLCHGERPCCETTDVRGEHAAACVILDGPCDCRRYEPKPDLFPPPVGRRYTMEGRCVVGYDDAAYSAACTAV